MKNKMLLLLLGIFLSTNLISQSTTPTKKWGIGLSSSLFPTTMYSQDELVVGISPTLDRQLGNSLLYIGLRFAPAPNGVVLGFQHYVLGMNRLIRPFVNADAQLGKVTLKQPTSCDQPNFKARDLMFLGSLNLGLETNLAANWVVHAQVGAGDLEVAGFCPGNEVNFVVRTGLRVWL